MSYLEEPSPEKLKERRVERGIFGNRLQVEFIKRYIDTPDVDSLDLWMKKHGEHLRRILVSATDEKFKEWKENEELALEEIGKMLYGTSRKKCSNESE